jgi:ParB family chromosome partitioning protein
MVLEALPLLRISGDVDVSDRIQEIPIERIRPNPQQPRTNFDPDALQELAESIREFGVLDPIKVERDGDNYILIDGERRLRASMQAGLAMIPAHIQGSLDDREKLVHALVHNLQRADMTLPEEGLAYQRLIDEFGIPNAVAVARLLHINPVKVYNALGSLRLEPEIRQLVIERRLPNVPQAFRALLDIPDAEARIKLAQRLADKQVSLAGVKVACASLTAKLLAASKTAENGDDGHPPAVSVARAQSQTECVPSPEWDALYQLGKVPAWPVLNDAIMATCDSCALRSVASEKTCGDCPLVQGVRRMMEATK